MSERLLIVDARAEALRARLAVEFSALEMVTAARPAEAMGRLDGVTGLIGFGYSFSDEMFGALPSLSWLQFLSSGTDRLAGFKSLAPQTVVTSCQGIHGPPVSEMAFFHMLSLSRGVQDLVNRQSRGQWARIEQRLLHGKTVVLVGTGVIARDFARRCKAFGMTVIGVSATPRRIEGYDDVLARPALADAAARADFLVLLTAYSEGLRNLVDARVLSAMKPSAVLINLARGALCDEDALAQALTDRQIAGAGLDVFVTEPLPDDHPLWGMDNVFITPHLAGMNDAFPDLMMPVLRENVQCFLEGRFSEMRNLVAR
jgi:phosphoglycerate dehydrogenase-like enzyme